MSVAETLFDHAPTTDPWTGAPRVQAALARVQRAFERMEQAAENLMLSSGNSEGESLHGQIAALKAENVRLTELLTKRESDVAELSEINAVVSDRLENSIQTLRTIIEQ